MSKNICFINNYNNEAYIRECLESVFSQTHPFDQVILVDDGSSDHSISIISEFTATYPNLRLHQKKNEGQFSSFNAALSLIPENSQIFLLDGDDIYPKDYLSLVLKQIKKDRWDFAFCEQQQFSKKSLPPDSALINDNKPYFFSSTSALTRSRGCWIGNPTSCLSLSSDLYKKIFPYCSINTFQWRINEGVNIQKYEPKEGFFKWHNERIGMSDLNNKRHLVFYNVLLKV